MENKAQSSMVTHFADFTVEQKGFKSIGSGMSVLAYLAQEGLLEEAHEMAKALGARKIRVSIKAWDMKEEK